MFKKITIAVIIFIICSFIVIHYVKKAKNKSTIIILNGPSASGKSSIQEAFVRISETPYIKIGIDNFFVGVLSNYYISGQYQPQDPHNIIMKGIPSVDPKTDKPIFTLEVGPAGQKIINGMNYAIQAYADAGNNIIVDYIAYDPEWLVSLTELLKNHRVILTSVTLALDILEERENMRATSPQGHARSHYKIVHNHKLSYDLVIDTSEITPEKAALVIKNYINSRPQQK